MKAVYLIAELSVTMSEKSHYPKCAEYPHFPHHWRLRVLPESHHRDAYVLGLNT